MEAWGELLKRRGDASSFGLYRIQVGNSSKKLLAKDEEEWWTTQEN